MKIEDIARVAHEANRAYCLCLGDRSQPAWDEAPDWQRYSAAEGVQAHLRSSLSAEESHELWLKKKQADGWKWGSVKDANKKEHPCIVPYAELPLMQQLKDRLFSAVVGAFKEIAI